jgi:hypothetical protein
MLISSRETPRLHQLTAPTHHLLLQSSPSFQADKLLHLLLQVHQHFYPFGEIADIQHETTECELYACVRFQDEEEAVEKLKRGVGGNDERWELVSIAWADYR